MSWKDRWTAFCWRITFPGEPCPLEILPSNYARLPKESEKLSLEDALVQAVLMDMDAYPNQWAHKNRRFTYDAEYYINETSNITIELDGVREWSCKIEGVEVGERGQSNFDATGRRSKIINAFNNRHGAEVLERLVDRIQKVTTVEYEEVVQEARPKTIDPFAPQPMETLAKQISVLKAAAQHGSSLPPPPRQLVSTSPKFKAIKKQPKPEFRGQGPLAIPKGTWRGKQTGKLNNKELDDLFDYVHKHPGISDTYI